MKTQDEAVIWLSAQVEPDIDPNLTSAEILSALLDNQIAKLYASSTAYVVGDRVMPSNGRIYKCLQPGTSASAAPTWPDYSIWRIGYRVSDGGVLWVDDGPAPDERFDLSAAAKQCWMLKASKASTYYNAVAKGVNFNEQQIYQHCLIRASSYESTWVP